ncbi:MAG TPA: endonuclease/exonuclease/phosphatase family protein [Pseudohaliea sp.]|nr:endonuclease/exonuclease/phosphatase family protein [Pseudohaliea sp.]HKL63312.1 endonuclease/exonuclease/phosphatase family protein [Woeseiaceae bacterium]
MVRRALRLAAAGGVALLLLPSAEPLWWGFGLPVHFPLQIAAGCLVLLACALVARERLPALAFTAIVAVSVLQAREQLPRFATAEASPTDLTAAVLNLDWRNPDLGAAEAWLRQLQADLVVLPEYTPAAARHLAGLADVYPYRLEEAREGAWGIALLSRHPIASGRVIRPAGIDSPALDAVLNTGDRQLRVLGVHPRSPISAGYTAERNAQLAAVADLVRESHGATLVCGDFNDTPFSPSFRAFTGRAGMANAAAGQGYPATFPAGWLPVWIPIDHCVYRGGLVPVRVQSGPDVGSDHYPLVAEFRW